jgi:hypothetical protein
VVASPTTTSPGLPAVQLLLLVRPIRPKPPQPPFVQADKIKHVGG